MKTVKLALIGENVQRSPSGKIHTFILGNFGYLTEYELVSVKRENFAEAVCTLMSRLDGFNVTAPYKRSVIPYLSEIRSFANVCKSVNTVVCGERAGYNTDGIGFLLSLERSGIDVNGKDVLVLGVGGAGRSVATALKLRGANVFLSRRNEETLPSVCAELSVNQWDGKRSDFFLVVNATGTDDPLHGKSVSNSNAYDLRYGTESAFLRLHKAVGCKVLTGDEMLFLQAYYSDCLYIGRGADKEEAFLLFDKYKKETEGTK